MLAVKSCQLSCSIGGSAVLPLLLIVTVLSYQVIMKGFHPKMLCVHVNAMYKWPVFLITQLSGQTWMKTWSWSGAFQVKMKKNLEMVWNIDTKQASHNLIDPQLFGWYRSMQVSHITDIYLWILEDILQRLHTFHFPIVKPTEVFDLQFPKHAVRKILSANQTPQRCCEESRIPCTNLVVLCCISLSLKHVQPC